MMFEVKTSSRSRNLLGETGKGRLLIVSAESKNEADYIVRHTPRYFDPYRDEVVSVRPLGGTFEVVNIVEVEKVVELVNEERTFLARELSPLVGAKIEAAFPTELDGELYPTLCVLTPAGKRFAVYAQQDAEGNGPGYLSITVIEVAAGSDEDVPGEPAGRSRKTTSGSARRSR